MSKSQKIILILIIIAVISIITILVVLLLRMQNGLSSMGKDDYTYVEEEAPKKELTVVSSRNSFYIVRDCINKYYTYCAIVTNPKDYYGLTQESDIQETKTSGLEIIYNMLDEEYIKSEGITKTNIANYVEKINSSVIDVKSMYVSETTNSMFAYVIKGTLRDKITNKISEFIIILKMDVTNGTFSIVPEQYVNSKYADIAKSKIVNIEMPEEIKKNENNIYTFRAVQDDTYAIDMFNQYKEQIMYNQDAIYDNLDEEYKKAKFANISEFKTYIKNRYKNPIMLKAESFSKTIRKEYTEYVFIDANGEYYIFKETAPMKYKIVLDTYTIDIPEFIAKYESANLQEKVVLNLNKFQEAINDKDYKYAYGLLADSFKENNFQTHAGRKPSYL